MLQSYGLADFLSISNQLIYLKIYYYGLADFSSISNQLIDLKIYYYGLADFSSISNLLICLKLHYYGLAKILVKLVVACSLKNSAFMGTYVNFYIPINQVSR